MGGNGRKAMPEVTVMKVPAPRWIRCGVKASMTRMVPSRLVSIVVSRRLEVRGVAQVLQQHDPGMVTTVSSSGYRARTASRARCDGGTVGDVDTESAEAFRGEFRERLRAAAADGHGAARRGEPAGQLPPDTRGPADDENGAVGEIHEIFPSVQGADGVQARGAVQRWSLSFTNSAAASLDGIRRVRQGPRLPWSCQGPL